MQRRTIAAAKRSLSFLVCTSFLTACGTAPSALKSPFGRVAPQRPLIFVPGILGSKLVHNDTGKSAWGGGFDVFFPRDYGYELALPIPSGDRSETVGHELVTTTVVDEVRLAFYRRQVYARVAAYFERRGYQLGSLDQPKPGDTLFLFPYDYRRSNLDAVRKLRVALDHLRRVRGERNLEFDLLCQSNGGYVCRYLARYGAQFDPVYGDRKTMAGPPRGLVLRRLALAGTANAGGLRILHELRDGRCFVQGVGRHFTPEILFAMRPLFDDLPWYPNEPAFGLSDIFIDQNGEPMAVDLYSAADWERYDLSVFSGTAEERLDKPRGRELFGDRQDRLRYLGERLRASRRLQEQLRATDTIDQDVELLMVQARDQQTPRRAVLVHGDAGWRTVFAGDREAQHLSQAVQALLTEVGDGHATIASQEALSPTERDWLVSDTVYATGTHFNLILDPTALRTLAEFFLTQPPLSWRAQ